MGWRVERTLWFKYASLSMFNSALVDCMAHI
ncbi:uncharacterized protein FFE2_00917 [Fusarium fujikuroi]|nr:uncharacterized protein FFE2_00917 [Fusarium fujikuroi]